MCGISGAIAFNRTGETFLQRVEEANGTLSRRGPDGGAVWQAGGTALGHRRLSIIDVSCAGDQPMSTPDGRFTIVFNGEIFNYASLSARYLSGEERAALRSQSDTEVLLALFAKMGAEVFPLLQGFFAAALYDRERDELTLVRDRFGKKPLLLYSDGDKLLFASEMKALFSMGGPREVAWNMLPVYLQLNYVPQPYSLVQGVRKLPPGHYLRVCGTVIEEVPYYRLQVRREAYGQYAYEEAQAELVRLMDKSVQLRLLSDVPLGAFLSGGIDSSVIVALAARHVDGLKTFSIGYRDHPYFDETRYAEAVAKRYRTDHTVFALGNEDFLEHIGGVMDYIDEPFADSSAIPEFILSYLTRKAVTVALSGDGGDEVFGGYNKHAAELKMRSGGALNSLVRLGGPLWNALPKSRNGKLTNTVRQLHRFAEGARLPAGERYWRWASFLQEGESAALLHPRLRAGLDRRTGTRLQQEYSGALNGADFNEVLLADMNLVLLSDMLVKVDMMSMANSLEIRSPFLDGDVVEFAFGLPVHYKLGGGLKKRIVQDAFRSSLPEELYNRPKRGFEIPLLDWFRKELWSLIDEDLLSDRFVREQEIFDAAAVGQLKRRLRSSDPGDSHATIWALLVFQHWWKRYIAG